MLRIFESLLQKSLRNVLSFIKKTTQKSDNEKDSNHHKKDHDQHASSPLAVTAIKVGTLEDDEKNSSANQCEHNADQKANEETFHKLPVRFFTKCRCLLIIVKTLSVLLMRVNCSSAKTFPH